MPKPLKATLKRFCIVVIFSIAFAYIEAAVVVYLRIILYPDGFSFPLTDFGLGNLWRQLLITETGREAATLVLIFAGSWLSARDRSRRLAYFLTIFAVWDIFYYIWLKVLINWPSSIMDWDILFLIPTVWASPVLAPLIVSITLLAVAMVILYRACYDKRIEVMPRDWLSFVGAAIIVVASFCIAGMRIAQPDYKVHFHWLLFAAGYIPAVAIFAKCALKSK